MRELMVLAIAKVFQCCAQGWGELRGFSVVNVIVLKSVSQGISMINAKVRSNL